MKFPGGFTDIQYYGIPEVLKRKDTILASQTGTGKTLAYLLPLVQLLHADEKAGMQTEVRRPPCLILLPNRELSKQVLSVVKSLSGHVKLRSAGITSGVKLKIQKESLASPVDILVSTPGRFLQHFEAERVFLSELRYLVVDEGDTLFDKTFKEDIEKMLGIVRKRIEKKGHRPPQTIVVTATVTADLSDAINTHFPTATLVATSGLHRPLPRLKHEYVNITTNDKHEPLLKVLLGSKSGGGRTIVFCNDMQSARSTHHFLTEQGFSASCMHSGILPKRRAEYFEQFASGECPILVCTDIASRGLDTTAVDHVVLFDFPETATGYLHRVGRTARGGRRGRVTCLLKKGEKVYAEAIDLANTKQVSLSEVMPYFSKTNPGKRERLAQWLDPLALLPDQKKKQQQQKQQQQQKRK